MILSPMVEVAHKSYYQILILMILEILMLEQRLFVIGDVIG